MSGSACRAIAVAPMVLALSLAGCSGQPGPFAMFHGMLAKNKTPAPGLHAPFPYLSSVPAKPQTLSAADQRQVRAQLEAANQAARAQLVPVVQSAPVAAAAPARQAPPLLIGFTPGSAIVQHKQRGLLRSLAQQRGDAPAILAAGFAPAADASGLNLALRRALAIADQLTSAGMPPGSIGLAALASGHGGFAQLLYDAPPPPQPKAAKDHP